MENKLITNPTTEDAEKLFSDFGCNPGDPIVLEEIDFWRTIESSESALVIEAKGTGENKLKEAIANLRDQAKSLYGLDLFKADKVLCLISTGKDFRIGDLNPLSDYFSKFPEEVDIIWGMKRPIEDLTNEIRIKLVAAYK